MTEFKDRIRGLREDKDMTQKMLGDKLGVSHNTVSAWENGINEPNIANLIMLSKIYNVSVDYLINNPISIDEEIKYIIDNITRNPTLKKTIFNLVKDINKMI